MHPILYIAFPSGITHPCTLKSYRKPKKYVKVMCSSLDITVLKRFPKQRSTFHEIYWSSSMHCSKIFTFPLFPFIVVEIRKGPCVNLNIHFSMDCSFRTSSVNSSV